jgi:ribosomal protein L11 methyltransferase
MTESPIVWAVQCPVTERHIWEMRLEAWAQWPSVITEMTSMIDIEVYGLSRAEALVLVAAYGGEWHAVEPVDWARTTEACEFPTQVHNSLWLAREGQALPDSLSAHVLWLPDTDAFGAQGHPSTMGSLRLLIEWIADHAPGTKDSSIYDLGCGMGVLSVAAGLLGFAEMTGWDLDVKAVQAARECSERHGLRSQSTFHYADLLKDWQPPSARAQVVCANLFADIMISLLPTMRSLVQPGGVLILAGILDRYAENCLEVLSEQGFTVQRQDRQGPWHALLAAAP